MSYPFKMEVLNGVVQVFDAITGELITTAEATDVSAIVVDEYKDVTNYRYISRVFNITIEEAKQLYEKR